MKTVQLKKDKGKDWLFLSPKLILKNPLVLVFGNRLMLEEPNIYESVRVLFPEGHIVIGSTSGDITSKHVDDKSITITAIEFEKSNFIIETSNISNFKSDSFKIGVDLVSQFPKEDLKLVFVLSEGDFVNGSELIKGMNSVANNDFLITGGLCGDDFLLGQTLASYNENPKAGEIIAVAFYGKTFEASCSVYGGWAPFGPERLVTKSVSNVLYELDNKPALELYKKYLGEKSKGLPDTALLFPFNVKSSDQSKPLVRTILNINEKNNSMIFAGDIPENSKVQLMMANVDNIANASGLATSQAIELRKEKAQLALLVSCIGRKLVLDQRIEEEIEGVLDVLEDETKICGFYSYGEIAPFHGEINSQLHNQTMTITLISE